MSETREARLARGRALHAVITGCDDLWDEIGDESHEDWCRDSDAYHAAIRPPDASEPSCQHLWHHWFGGPAELPECPSCGETWIMRRRSPAASREPDAEYQYDAAEAGGDEREPRRKLDQASETAAQHTQASDTEG